MMSHLKVKSAKLTSDKNRKIKKFNSENSDKVLPIASSPVLKRTERKRNIPTTKKTRKKNVRFTI